jgi:cellobiose phosphorylase
LFDLTGDTLHLAPCLPAHWQSFTIHYRYRETVYHIVIAQTRVGGGQKSSVTVDGVERQDATIPLVDDHGEHRVEVTVLAL